MTEVLIVVDSPDKAEFFSDYYGERAACVVCGWPLFRTSHQTISASSSPSWAHFQFDPIHDDAQECIAALHAYQDKDIFLALDATARGNYLCWQIYGYLNQLGGRPERIKRLLPAALSPEELDAALHSVRPVDERQGLSYYNHQLFDDCLSRHLARLIGTDHGPGNLPLRQNSLTMLFLLAERERERAMFPLIMKWQVQAELPVLGKGFTVCLAKGLDIPADGLIRDEAKARLIRNTVGAVPFVVESIRRSPLTIAPPQPYQLAELLHDAFVLLDLNPATAMAMVQKLFHGIRVNGVPRGLISSPFPGTAPLSQDTLSAIRKRVAMLHGDASLAEWIQPETGMIIPVAPELSDAELKQTLTQDEAGLYNLIRARALTSQMRAAVGSTIMIDFRAGKKNLFRAHFHELNDPGFLQRDPEKLAQIQTPCPAPNIQEGQEFKPLMVSCQQVSNASQAPEPYTIDSLFAALADFSISADPITLVLVDTLVKTGYAVISRQGLLKPADNTNKVISILNRAFPRMQGLNLAAYIEQTISEATGGRKELDFALKQFDQTLVLHGKILVKIKIPPKLQPRLRASSTIIKHPAISQEERVPLRPPVQEEALPEAEPKPAMDSLAPLPVEIEQPPQPPTTEPLPEEPSPLESADTPEVGEDTAGNEPEIPAGAADETAWADDDLKAIFAQALSDSPPAPESADQPQAKALIDSESTEPLTTPDQERLCPVCGKTMLLKEDPFGAFWGCSGFPDCRYSKAMDQPGQGLACPLCGLALNRKQTPTGKNFYVCGSSDCQFMSWSRPHYLPCGLCDSPYLVEKLVRGITTLRCPRAGCPYEQAMPGANPEMRPQASEPGTKKKVLVRRVASGTGSSTSTQKVRIVRRRK
jgi:DNA topoisomerase IA/ssDNA-binding Zn-finger/Zn-ribbon topoisomerase 1